MFPCFFGVFTAVSGYTAFETSETIWQDADHIIKTAQEFSELPVELPDCTTNEDCGSSYYGPWICENRYSRPIQFLYEPRCKLGRCVHVNTQKETDECKIGEICITGMGCVDNSTLPVQLSYSQPIIYAKLVRDKYQTVYKDESVRNVINILNNYNRSLNCQYYGGEGWEDKVRGLEINESYAFDVIEDPPGFSGRIEYIYPLRCGNGSNRERGDITPLYYENLSYIVQYINYPLIYGFHVSPDKMLLPSCVSTKYASYTLVNHGQKNITCAIKTDIYPEFQISISDGSQLVELQEITFNYSTRIYNTTYIDPWNGSNMTLYNVNYSNITVISAAYNITKPKMVQGKILVQTNDCAKTIYPITITCKDDENFQSTKREDIQLSYGNPFS